MKERFILCSESKKEVLSAEQKFLDFRLECIGSLIVIDEKINNNDLHFVKFRNCLEGRFAVISKIRYLEK